jgi:hypothetical protein
MTATATETFTPDPAAVAAMKMADLRKSATTLGITVPRGATKMDIANAIAGAAKAAHEAELAKAAANPAPIATAGRDAVVAAKGKKSGKKTPVRNDVTPADVTADPHTPEQAAEIATLEGYAHKFIANGESAAMSLADTIVKLYALAPWEGKKLTNGHPMSLAYYYANVIGVGTAEDKLSLPLKARQFVVETMANTVDVETVMAMAGASRSSIQRDREKLQLANPNRQNGQPTRGAGAPAASTPTVSDGPVTRMIPVLSLTSVREFILGLGTDKNTDALEELSELISEQLTALSATV